MVEDCTKGKMQLKYILQQHVNQSLESNNCKLSKRGPNPKILMFIPGSVDPDLPDSSVTLEVCIILVRSPD